MTQVKIIYSFFFFLLLGFPLMAQDASQGLIYGKVSTTNGDYYQGFLRWGDEEVYWRDVFNGSKMEKNSEQNPFRNVDNGTEKTNNKSRWTNYSWNLLDIWEVDCDCSYHQFAVMFSEIQRLEILSSDEVNLTLKNGAVVRLEDNSNDIDTDISVLDDEIGEVTLDWDRINEIEFMPAPANLRSWGKPIYGTVETLRKGSFTGWIAWDKQERMSQDVLDGDQAEIPFGRIDVIEKSRGGCAVTLRTGKDIFLSGTNDVNDGNDGIFVHVDGMGQVDIGWSEFEKLSIIDCDAVSGYNDFVEPKGIYGTVKTILDDEYTGVIAYDIDELWEGDLLDGEDGDLSYQIPFRYIKRIAPKNDDYSIIELRNGEELLLGDTQDVSDSNNGVLVIPDGSNEAIHVSWNHILEIILE